MTSVQNNDDLILKLRLHWQGYDLSKATMLLLEEAADALEKQQQAYGEGVLAALNNLVDDNYLS